MIDCGCDEILLPQGSDGVNGKNAYTVTTASFVQPNVGIAVTITVSDTLQSTNQWAIVGQIIRITDSGGRGGWYQVTGITGTTQITAINLDYQPGSSVAGVTIQAGAGVSPAGLKGVDGQDGGVGLQGPVGPAPNMSIGNVSQLNPGDQPTVQVNGGGGNYTIDFGIPQGLPGTSGATLVTSYNITGTSFLSSSGGTTSTLIPTQGFDPSSLCPTDGTAGRIRINLQCTRTTTNLALTDKDDKFSLAFYVQQPPATIIEFKPSQSTTYFNDKYQIQFINGITCETRATGLISPFSATSVTSVSIEMMINRISSTSFIYTVEYIWSNGQSYSNVFTGYVTSNWNFALSTAQYNMNIINFSNQNHDIFVRGSLTMEKIIS
jgi:hypothetical protein